MTPEEIRQEYVRVMVLTDAEVVAESGDLRAQLSATRAALLAAAGALADYDAHRQYSSRDSMEALRAALALAARQAAGE